MRKSRPAPSTAKLELVEADTTDADGDDPGGAAACDGDDEVIHIPSLHFEELAAERARRSASAGGPAQAGGAAVVQELLDLTFDGSRDAVSGHNDDDADASGAADGSRHGDDDDDDASGRGSGADESDDHTASGSGSDVDTERRRNVKAAEATSDALPPPPPPPVADLPPPPPSVDAPPPPPPPPSDDVPPLPPPPYGVPPPPPEAARDTLLAPPPAASPRPVSSVPPPGSAAALDKAKARKRRANQKARHKARTEAAAVSTAPPAAAAAPAMDWSVGRALTAHSYVLGLPQVRVPDVDHSYAFNAVGRAVCRQLTRANVNAFVRTATGGGALHDGAASAGAGRGRGGARSKAGAEAQAQASGYTLLHTAALSCDIDLAVHCLRRGGDLQRLSAPNLETPLQLAVSSALVLHNKLWHAATAATKASAAGAARRAGGAAAAGAAAASSSSASAAELKADKALAEAAERRFSFVSYALDVSGGTGSAAAGVNNRDVTGRTALHSACSFVAAAAAGATSAVGGRSYHALDHALALCDLLLAFGADANAPDFDDATPAGAAELSGVVLQRFQALVARHKPAGAAAAPAAAAAAAGPSRPARVRRCWCASGVEHWLCHGLTEALSAQTQRALPVVPDWLDCPCGNAIVPGTGGAAAATQKSAPATTRAYVKCCKRRGVVYRESDTEFIREVSVANPGAAGAAAAITHKDVDLKQVDARTADREAKTAVLTPMVASGACDPAYLYALLRVEFWPNVWTRIAAAAAAASGGAGAGAAKVVPVVTEAEAIARQTQWNALIDEYITRYLSDEVPVQPEGATLRTAADVSRATKIGAHGGALYRTCAGPRATTAPAASSSTGGTAGGVALPSLCGAWESHGSEFDIFACSKCRAVVYCSDACRARGWTHGGHAVACAGAAAVAAAERAGAAAQVAVMELPSQRAIRQLLLQRANANASHGGSTTAAAAAGTGAAAAGAKSASK